jgi:hypothetical protein
MGLRHCISHHVHYSHVWNRIWPLLNGSIFNSYHGTGLFSAIRSRHTVHQGRLLAARLLAADPDDKPCKRHWKAAITIVCSCTFHFNEYSEGDSDVVPARPRHATSLTGEPHTNWWRHYTKREHRVLVLHLVVTLVLNLVPFQFTNKTSKRHHISQKWLWTLRERDSFSLSFSYLLSEKIQTCLLF